MGTASTLKWYKEDPVPGVLYMHMLFVRLLTAAVASGFHAT